MLGVTLLGVLLAVAIPSYNAYRDRARTRMAAQQIAAMAAVIDAAWQENRAYPANLAEVNMANLLDPWGRPYVYYNVDAGGRGGARKDKAQNPINTDFDLYSVGPDGRTKPQVSQKDSLDDVIRANNGAFIGVAADF